MNIQKINFNQNFGAKIGPNLNREITNKKEYISKHQNYFGEKELDEINNAEEKIKELLPNVYDSPVTVDIGVFFTKQFENNKWIAKKAYGYIIQNRNHTFHYHTPRYQDAGLKSFKYQKLISTLKKLETVLNAIEN